MKAMENVIDEMVIEKTGEKTTGEVIREFINLAELYVSQLIELRPQRAYKLSMVKNKLERYRNAITRKQTDEYTYWEIMEELANIHRTGKEIKRQMTQQFGKTPDFLDLSESLMKNQEIDASKTMAKLRGRDL